MIIGIINVAITGEKFTTFVMFVQKKVMADTVKQV